jgi:hypothetical protein
VQRGGLFEGEKKEKCSQEKQNSVQGKGLKM